MTMTDNPRAVAGDNMAPDYAREIADQMARDYAELANTTGELLADARKHPETLATEEEMLATAALVKRLRDTSSRADSNRKTEKEPHFRRGQGIDQFFFGLMDRLKKGANVLEGRVDYYNQRKLAREREERERAAREAARIAREAAERAAAEQRARDDEIARAARARNENKVEEHKAAAEQHGAAAQDLGTAATQAAYAAEDARIETTRKPGDLVRSRDEGTGTLVTMRQVPHVEITDKSKLDWALLAPFIKDDHALMALKKWAATTSHRVQMAGAVIEMRDGSVIR